jgi:hypothetical protein
MRVWVAEEKRFVRARFDASRLPPGVWFVRSGKGNGLMPVTREGTRVLLMFMLGMLGSAIVGGLIMGFVSQWVGVAVIVVGMVASPAWFIMTAKRHGDSSINAMDLVVRSST